jgi:uncharacterized repeat protein (TIGR03847 family)
MGVFYEFDEVDSFTVGAMGQPGQRTFYLQARRGPTRVSIKCEKQQASAISEYLRKVLSDLPVPADTPRPVAMDLAAPFDAAFVLGPIGLGYDRENDRVLVQMEEVVPVDEDGESDPELAADRGHVRVFLTRGQAHAFCEHDDVVVAAGRPPCTWCGLPLDPEGHACPRMN